MPHLDVNLTEAEMVDLEVDALSLGITPAELAAQILKWYSEAPFPLREDGDDDDDHRD